MTDTADAVRYRVTGMDCAHDAAEIEEAARGVAGVDAVKVSVATQIMTTRVVHPEVLPAVERAVVALGYQLDRIGHVASAGAGVGDVDGQSNARSYMRPAYKRALWIVVLLNAGYGVLEAAGGYLAGSQALEADALDFLGDGLITFPGLLAMGRSLRWRARAALAQGLFLGALGLSVLGTTAYRVLVQQHPEAELMGAFGAGALVVNVLAALFLQSAFVIVRDARIDLAAV
jgi:cation transport ATPase